MSIESQRTRLLVFSLVSCVAMVHGVREAMKNLMETGTDFSTAKGMDPKAFFEVMGKTSATRFGEPATNLPPRFARGYRFRLKSRG
jgi:hypothetical protein